MDDLDFTSDRPAKSEIYSPDVARACFKALGKEEVIPQGGQFFAENQASDKMYLLVEGEVSLVRGKKMIDVVKAGEIFGEMATISRLPRSASAVARSGCIALSMNSAQFLTAIQKTPEFALMLMNILINRLRLTVAALAVTKSLPGNQDLREKRVFDARLLAQLQAQFQARPAQHAPLNKVIMKEGESGAFMYVVVEGRVAISVKGKIVERIGTGGIFGEMALMDQSPRAGTATAETDCMLLTVNRKDFLDLVKNNPAFAVSMLLAMADRLRQMTSLKK